MNQSIKLLAVLLALATPAISTAQELHTFSNGAVADADKINENFTVLEGRIASHQVSVASCTATQKNNTAAIECQDGSSAALIGYGSVIVFPDGVEGELPTIDVSLGKVLVLDSNDQALGEADGISTPENSFDTSVAAICPEQVYYLWTQNDVNNFPRDCSEVTGSIYVDGYPNRQIQTDINDLSPLSGLKKIGSLSIANTKLTNLSGLEGLISISQELNISGNELLSSIVELSNVRLFDGRLSITGNPILTDLMNTESFSGEYIDALRLSGNTHLQDCRAIASVLGYPARTPYEAVRYYWRINDNGVGCSSTSEIFASMGTVHATIEEPVSCQNPIVTVLTNQTSVDSFQSEYGPCNTIGGILELKGDDITNLDGLSPLIAVNALKLDAPSLINADALRKLKVVDDIDVRSPLPESFAFDNLLKAGVSNFTAVSSSGSWGLPRKMIYTDSLYPRLSYYYRDLLLTSKSQIRHSRLKEICGLVAKDTSLTSLEGLEAVKFRCPYYERPTIDLSNNANLGDIATLETAKLTSNRPIEYRLTNNALLETAYIPQNLLNENGDRYFGMPTIQVSGTPIKKFIGFDDLKYTDLDLGDNVVIGPHSFNLESSGIYSLTLRGSVDARGLEGISDLPELTVSTSTAASLNGLSTLRSVGSLEVKSSSLLNLDFLANLQEVRSINLSSNQLLENITALQSIEAQTSFPSDESPKVGDLYVFNNPLLQKVDLRRWHETARAIVTRYDTDGVFKRYPRVSFINNNRLTDIRLFEFSDEFGEIKVLRNEMLRAIPDLNAPSTGYSLIISENNVFDDCSSAAMLLGFPIYPHDESTDKIAGLTQISSNAPGAMSPDECLESIDSDRDSHPDVFDAFPSDPNEAFDSDGDGLGDNYEMANGLDRKNPDSDSDGVNDGLEIEQGSDPLDPTSLDSDGDGLLNAEDTDDDNDGYTDQHELEMGADPLNSDDMPRSGGLSPALLRVISQEVIKDNGGG